MRGVDPRRWDPLVFPVLFGIALRFAGLTRQPLWVDEILTLRSASLGEPFSPAHVLLNPQGPLPHVLLRLWAAVFGDGDAALRAWAATAGALGLILAAAAFRRLAPRAALAGTWLFAVSPFHLWYSQEVRNYVFLLAASIVALWSFHRAAEQPRPRRWLEHGLALGLLGLCNLSGLFLIPALGVVALARGRKVAAGFAGAGLVALLATTPWIVETARHHMAWEGVTGVPSADEPIRGGRTFDPLGVPFTYAVFLGGYGLGPPLRALHDGLPPAAWLPFVPALLAGAAGAAACLAGAWPRRRDPAVPLLAAAAFLPVVAAILVAAAGLKAFNPRYVAVSQPAFLLLLAIGGGELAARRRTTGRIALLALAAAVITGGIRQGVDPRYAREDFRSAARYLAAAGPEDLILEQGVSGPLARYHRGPAPLTTWFQVYFQNSDGGREKLASMVVGRRRVFWIGSRLWYEDPDRRVRSWLLEMGEGVEERSWTGVDLTVVRLAEPRR